MTGQAAAALGPDGRFVIPAAARGPFPEIDQQQAITLARAYVAQYGLLTQKRWDWSAPAFVVG